MKKWLSLILCAAMLCALIPGAVAEGTVEKVVLPYMLTMNAAEQRDMVQDAINAITVDKIGVEVELVCIDFASWSTQMNLMLTDGSVDLFNCCFMSSLSSLADSGAIAPLDDLYATYGQGISELLGDYVTCGRVGGVLYGVPKIDAYSSRLTYIMNADVCNELGITADSIHNFEDLTNVGIKVKEAHPEMCIFPTGVGGDLIGPVGFDPLGTTGNNIFGGLILANNDLKVVNVYETKEFEELVAYCKRWSELGLIIDDPLNAQDGGVAYLSSKASFGAFGGGFDPAVTADAQSNNCGLDLIGVELQPTNYATTDSVSGMTWCISAMSEHKEAAMKLLNELYTNVDLANLVCSGIEGVHYVKDEQGTLTFADGLDAFSTGWPSGMGTFWPNITITTPWEPNPIDYYDRWVESNKDCNVSAAMGFTFDPTNVVNEIAACTNVVTQYYNSIMLNIGDQDALLAEFRQELHDAGIDTIIAEKQAQLDAWAAAK